jgi:membrane protease YdiL (CAAX protease family)
MLATQFIRLHQTDPALWIMWDYAGRLGAMGILATIPAARAVAFQKAPSRLLFWELAVWIIAAVLIDQLVCNPIRLLIDGAVPNTRLGLYPQTTGGLHLVDMTLGLALVATSEELLFRRCSRYLLRNFIGDGYLMIVTTSALFAAYHWWTGIGNIVAVFLIGCVLMLFYRWSKALWPVVITHYLIDLVTFS